MKVEQQSHQLRLTRMKGGLLCILVTVLSTLVVSEAAAYKTTFKSAKAPRETIENYEEVTPIIAKEGDSKPYPVLLWVTIPTKLENFTLVLHMNHDAVPRGFSSMYYNVKGELVKDTNHYDNCYYHGSVEGHPKWIATMAACNELQGDFGLLSDRQQFYHIEPLDQHNSKMGKVHVVYKDTEYKIPQGRCGSGNHSMKHHLKDLEKRSGGDSQYRMKRQSSANIVEWVVVNDRRQYVSQGSSLTATVQRAIAIANSMSNIYNAINIRIALVNSVTFTDSDKFTIVSDTNTLLTSFTSYVQNSRNNVPMHDSVMLLTGIDLTGNTVGKSFTGAMCGSQSVGLTQDGGRSLTSVVSTAAHELGHIFDMTHYDEISGCTCSDPNGCVMRSISNGGASIFSPCSVTAVTQFLQSPTFTNCLSNNPSTTLEGQRCGNGIVEQGETCDCGEPAHCRNPCCNPNTCQLSTGSQCAVGQCCNTGTCQFLSSSTVCRSRATTDCDIAETCTGNSADCPADVTVVDGTSCLSNTGYCFRGQCPTHSAQCLAAWNSQDGFSVCYNYNRQGLTGGNCGHVGTTYTPCSVSNIRCGQLQCRQGTYQNIYNVAGGTLFTLTTGSGNCNSYGIQLPSDVVNPGLVLDGTKCGTNMVCQAQQCRNISDALNPPTCPTGTNGQVCSGSAQGICNNLGQCSCSSGFVPPNCESATSVNECNTNNGGCSQLCTDTTNFFTCSCRSGYALNSDGRTCNDINECTSGTHNCAQNCNNNAGTFTCTCNAGYNLNSNGRTCDVASQSARRDIIGVAVGGTVGALLAVGLAVCAFLAAIKFAMYLKKKKAENPVSPDSIVDWQKDDSTYENSDNTDYTYIISHHENMGVPMNANKAYVQHVQTSSSTSSNKQPSTQVDSNSGNTISMETNVCYGNRHRFTNEIQNNQMEKSEKNV